MKSCFRELALATFLTLAMVSTVAADDNLSVLSALTAEKAAPASAFQEWLKNECFTALANRRAAYDQVTTADDVRQWQWQRREFFLRQLGSFPPRTPLNPQVVRTLEGDGYRIENVIYESQPNHHVTANLYLPLSEPPYPAVIVPCGHSYNGKASAGYQRVSMLLARNGIAALCYDPIGQGERYQTFASDGTPLDAEYEANPNSLRQLESIPGNPRFNPVEEHTLIGVGSILVGRNTATYRIFDGIRSIDYLVSRDDIDPDKIGCTGNSGGGTLTAYLMALDERIVCAAPACYLTTFERLLQTNGPQDAEQNIFGQIAFGLDQADYVLLRAPRPTCLLAGTRDATFDIVGTWEIFRESKRFFARLDHPERVDLVEADAPHGFTEQLRVGAVRWMRRWLLEIDEPVSEPELPIRSDAELQCTPDGQVMLLPGERSVFELNRAEQQRLEQQKSRLWKDSSPDELREAVRATTGVSSPENLPRYAARQAGQVLNRDGYHVEKLILEAEGRAPLVALGFIPEMPAEAVFLYLHGDDKSVDADVGGPIEQLVLQGNLVLAVDLSGLGELAGGGDSESRRRHWSRALFGPDGESFWLAYLLGKSLVGLRAEEILGAAAFLEDYHVAKSSDRSIHLVGIAASGLPALHAMAIEPQRFASLYLKQTLRSWKDVLVASLGHRHLAETVHGAVRLYDLPDLVELIGPERVRIEEAIVPR